MPYNTADSIPRPEISTLLMEAAGQQSGFIAQEVFPVYPSPTEVGRYPVFPKKEAELLNAGRGVTSSTPTFSSITKRGQSGTYNELDRKFTWDSFTTEEYGLEERVDDVLATRMSNFFDAEMTTGKLLANSLMLDYEMEAASTLFNTSTFASLAYNGTGSAGTAWSSVTDTDIPQQINTGIEYMTLRGEKPDTLLLSLKNFNYLRRSSKMLTYIYGTLNTNAGGAMITAQAVAGAFGLSRVIVAEKSVNQALKGMAVSLGAVWGNPYVALIKSGAGDFMNGGLGRTIIWDADSPGGLFTSESYRDEARRGTKLRVRSNRVIKVLLTDCAYLLGTNVS